MQTSKWGYGLAVKLLKTLVERLRRTSSDNVVVAGASKDEIDLIQLDRRREALARMRARRGTLPSDYRFDRDEANER